VPTIADLVRVRPEVTSGALHGIISLYSLISDEEDAFEKAADRVLSATFPSEALLRLLQRLQVSLSEADADRKGNFVFSGGYGSGKSHLLLTLYHTLRSPDVAAAWLSEHAIEFVPPNDAVVVLLPMNQLTKPDGSSVDYLWEPIFDALGYDGFNHTGGNFPTAKHIEEAVAGRRVFLIIDEIERWYMPQQQNNAQAQANLTFLQNLTEYCQDAANGVFTILTLLRLDAGVQSIIDRVDAFREDLTQAPDRRQIVLHRLVESVDAVGSAAVVDAYIEQYRPVDSHLGIADFARYRDDMLRCYPFHPVAIETVFDRYSSVASLQDTSYQNSRGALYLLAHVLREAVQPSSSVAISFADLIRVGDISLTNPRIYEDLASLDTQLVNIARRNTEASGEVEHGDAVLSTVLLHSLGNPQATRRLGAELKDLLLGVLRPPSSPGGGVGPNQVQACLVRLQDTAINLWPEENPPRWVFRTDVNILTQVNRRAKTEAVIKQAPGEIVAAIRELVSGSLSVFPAEDVPDARDITIVVSTKHLERDDVIGELYKGKAYPNGLVIVIPRSQGSILEDPDLLWLAQTKIAAEQIRKEMLGTGEVPKLLADKATNQELLKALPGRYGKWLTPVLDATTNELHFRGIDIKLDKTSILAEVEKRYDTHHFDECVMDAVSRRETPPTVDDIRADFYRQRSYPKPVGGARATDTPIDAAIQRLVRSADLEVIIGGDAHYVCGKDPGFLQKTWTVAIPPEEHKPRFDVRGTIANYLAPKKETGALVKDIRARCHDAIKQYPDEVIEDSRIDDVLVELVSGLQLEIPSVETPPSPPLSESLVVRVRERLIDLRPTITLGPGSPQSIKTSVIKDVNKTDKLSQVTLDLERTAKGKAVDKLGQVLGLPGTQVGDATQLEVRCYLREAAVTNRDQLVQLLDALPKSGDPKVTVKFTKESPKEQGG
jgi:hypothetical protein